MDQSPAAASAASVIKLRKVGAYQRIRVLAWAGDLLYACRGYDIVRWHAGAQSWESVAHFQASWWRNLTSRSRLTYRLVRDGFHALAVLDDGTLVGAVPGAIVTCRPGTNRFQVTHRIARGTRPLHITRAPSGRIYWGEYFDNLERAEVHIYSSDDRGEHWQVAYTFPRGNIRHIHNIVYDRWGDCLWIMTGDEGGECKILRASCDLRTIDTVLEGNQQCRAVAAIPGPDGVCLSTDTPYEKNHIYRLSLGGNLHRLGDLDSSSIYGCRVGDALFFSTLVEPSAANPSREIQIVGAREGATWHALLRWTKDDFPMRYFQYGNAFLPDGDNATKYLAVTTIAVSGDDLTTTLWQVE